MGWLHYSKDQTIQALKNSQYAVVVMGQNQAVGMGRLIGDDTRGRASVQLIAAQGKEGFYEKKGFRRIPHEYCGSGMRKLMHKD